VRVSARDRDIVQEIIALLRGNDFAIDIQFTDFRPAGWRRCSTSRSRKIRAR
jgi:hypothetical protein